jgi:glyoxylase-like metal-dependent hydrolase (beta-lactamase superfamily II)
MTELTRRAALGGAAAVALTPLAANAPAFAAAPPVGKQAPGYYRYKVGSFEITVVTDGARTAPLGDTYVRNMKKDDVSKALEAAFLPKDTLTTPFNPIVVNTGSKLVLIDTGLGAGMYAQSKGAVGQLNANLAAAGIAADAIDTVIISHFHPDHINGLVGADNKPVFTKAEVMVPAGEWKFWMDDAAISKLPEGVQGNQKNVKRVFGGIGNKVTQYDAGKEIAPGITTVATPGHTPGHVSHVVASGNAKVMVQADVTNVPFLFARNPGWHVMFDMNAAQAEATRRKLYDMLAAEKMMVQGFHYPFPSVAFIEKAGSGYREIQVPWSPTI